MCSWPVWVPCNSRPFSSLHSTLPIIMNSPRRPLSCYFPSLPVPALTSCRRLVVFPLRSVACSHWSLVIFGAFRRGLFFVVSRVVFPEVSSFVRHCLSSRPFLFGTLFLASSLLPRLFLHFCREDVAASDSLTDGAFPLTRHVSSPWRGFSCGVQGSFCWENVWVTAGYVLRGKVDGYLVGEGDRDGWFSGEGERLWLVEW